MKIFISSEVKSYKMNSVFHHHYATRNHEGLYNFRACWSHKMHQGFHRHYATGGHKRLNTTGALRRHKFSSRVKLKDEPGGRTGWWSEAEASPQYDTASQPSHRSNWRPPRAPGRLRSQRPRPASSLTTSRTACYCRHWLADTPSLQCLLSSQHAKEPTEKKKQM